MFRAPISVNTIQSAFLCCRSIPTILMFGVLKGEQHMVSVAPDVNARIKIVPSWPSSARAFGIDVSRSTTRVFISPAVAR
jgi:hypothetical protein